MNGDPEELLPRDELRALEARIEAQFETIGTRFATLDEQLASLADRVDAAARSMDMLDEHLDVRSQLFHQRSEDVEARIVRIDDSVLAHLALREQRLTRQVFLILAAVTGAVAVLAWAFVLAAT